jgi:hypothetical protein
MELNELKSNTFVGFVEDNQDPKKLGRCRVRVMNVFEEIPKEDIPWAKPWKDLNGNQFTVPDVGKVVTVIFDGGNVYKPQYIYAEHYNINLEEKLKQLSGKNYTSMRSLMFDHKTQIYVNDEEGLKMDHKFNNINITKDSIDINLKDNFAKVNIGTKTAGQQAVLGNHFMDWMTEFVTTLCSGPAFVISTPVPGSPVVGNPKLVELLGKFMTLKNTKFLSHHVNVVDNSYVTKLNRINNSQIGDNYKSTLKPSESSGGSSGSGSGGNSVSPNGGSSNTPQPTSPSGTNDTTGSNSTPKPGEESLPAPTKEPVDYKPQDGSSEDSPEGEITPNVRDFSGGVLSTGAAGNASGPIIPTENPDVFMLLKALQRKSYVVYDQPYEVNIVGIRKVFPGDMYTNAFSDDLYLFYKNDQDIWQIHKYPISTMPGVYKATVYTKDGKKSIRRDPNGMNVKMTEVMKSKGGLGILKESQYIDGYYIGTYDKYPAMITSRSKPQKFYRDKTDSMRITYSKEGQGSVGMYMHRGFGGGQSVNNWSEGCQVFKSESHMTEFFEKCQPHKDKYGNKFTYTLMTTRDLS